MKSLSKLARCMILNASALFFEVCLYIFLVWFAPLNKDGQIMISATTTIIFIMAMLVVGIIWAIITIVIWKNRNNVDFYCKNNK